MSELLKISILTTARSDFGLLKRVIKIAAERFHVDLLITGSHFLRSRGSTVREIEEELATTPNVFLIRLDGMNNGTSATDQVAVIADTNRLASEWFAANRCDFLLFLGDRWELWGVTLPAFLHGIPMGHISGGEVTEGAIDDAVRHSHTKISALHFAATEAYATNLSRMGEEDWRISVVGECGLDQIYNSEIATSLEVETKFGVCLDKPTLLVTFHPSTLEIDTPVILQIGALINALRGFEGYQIVFTSPGIEQGSDVVLDAIRCFIASHPNALYVESFGSRSYLTVMKSAKAVIGNSSSGIVEAPSLGVPAINVGQRQKNRLSAESVQHVSYSVAEIRASIELALTLDYQQYARKCVNPYDPHCDGNNSRRIVDAVENALKNLSPGKLRRKKFHTKVSSDQWNYLLKKES